MGNGKKVQNGFNHRVDSISSAEKQVCDTCDDRMVFVLETREGETFHVGMSTILECLYIAEKNGAIPLVPSNFWVDIENAFKLGLGS